jgi:hypothetical protein
MFRTISVIVIIVLLLYIIHLVKPKTATEHLAQNIVDSTEQDTWGNHSGGTKAQKINYPKYTNLLEYGITTSI